MKKTSALLSLFFLSQTFAAPRAFLVNNYEYENLPELSSQSHATRILNGLVDNSEKCEISTQKDGTAFYPLKKNLERLLTDLDKDTEYYYWKGHTLLQNNQFFFAPAEAEKGKNSSLIPLSLLAQKANDKTILFIESKSLTKQAIKKPALEKAFLNFPGIVILVDKNLLLSLDNYQDIFKSKNKPAFLQTVLEDGLSAFGRALKVSREEINFLKNSCSLLDTELNKKGVTEKLSGLYSRVMLNQARSQRTKGELEQFLNWHKTHQSFQQLFALVEKENFDKLKKQLKYQSLESFDHPDWRVLQKALKRAQASLDKQKYAEARQAYQQAEATIKIIYKEICGNLVKLLHSAKKRDQSHHSLTQTLLKLAPQYAEQFAYPGYRYSALQELAMRHIPAGIFSMGSPSSHPLHEGDEKQHQVHISKGFYLGENEISIALWQKIMGPELKHKNDRASYPVSVSWEQAQKFCQKLSQKTGKTFRLPTEAEWEYACRADSTTTYNSGESFQNTPLHSCHQGTANQWGLRNMHGNLWEWCSDWSYPYTVKTGALVNPKGPSESFAEDEELDLKVVRGGSWNDPLERLRSANRWEYSPSVRSEMISFRVVMEMK